MSFIHDITHTPSHPSVGLDSISIHGDGHAGCIGGSGHININDHVSVGVHAGDCFYKPDGGSIHHTTPSGGISVTWDGVFF